jgi:hypothetical protein
VTEIERPARRFVSRLSFSVKSSSLPPDLPYFNTSTKLRVWTRRPIPLETKIKELLRHAWLSAHAIRTTSKFDVVRRGLTSAVRNQLHSHVVSRYTALHVRYISSDMRPMVTSRTPRPRPRPAIQGHPKSLSPTNC